MGSKVEAFTNVSGASSVEVTGVRHGVITINVEGVIASMRLKDLLVAISDEVADGTDDAEAWKAAAVKRQFGE